MSRTSWRRRHLLLSPAGVPELVLVADKVINEPGWQVCGSSLSMPFWKGQNLPEKEHHLNRSLVWVAGGGLNQVWSPVENVYPCKNGLGPTVGVIALSVHCLSYPPLMLTCQSHSSLFP